MNSWMDTYNVEAMDAWVIMTRPNQERPAAVQEIHDHQDLAYQRLSELQKHANPGKYHVIYSRMYLRKAM